MSEEFGQSIKEAREQRGWSQEFLAAKVGATQSTIDRIESGLTRKSRVLPEIAAILDLHLPGFEKRQAYTAPVGGFTRVSYVLPQELIERIERYKDAIGVSSDDEVVRRIIDDFLKKRDDVSSLVGRLVEKIKTTKSLREAAGLVLANHPLVNKITFENHLLEFELSDGINVKAYSINRVRVRKSDGSKYIFYRPTAPEWVPEDSLTNEISEADDLGL